MAEFYLEALGRFLDNFFGRCQHICAGVDEMQTPEQKLMVFNLIVDLARSTDEKQRYFTALAEDLSIDLQAVYTHTSLLQAKVTEQAAVLADKEATIASNNAVIRALQHQVLQLQAQMQELRQQLQQQRAECEELRQHSQQPSVEQLLTEAEALRGQVADLSRQAAEVQLLHCRVAELTRQAAELGQMRSRAEAAESSAALLSRQAGDLSRIAAEAESLRTRATQAESSVGELRRQMAALEAAAQASGRAVESARGAQASTEFELRLLESRYKKEIADRMALSELVSALKEPALDTVSKQEQYWRLVQECVPRVAQAYINASDARDEAQQAVQLLEARAEFAEVNLKAEHADRAAYRSKWVDRLDRAIAQMKEQEEQIKKRDEQIKSLKEQISAFAVVEVQ